MRRLLISVGAVVAVLSNLSVSAIAQVDVRTIIDGFIRPGGIIDKLSARRDAASGQRLSDKPSFNCTNVSNTVARILCSDRDGAKADWDLNSTLWAIAGSNDETRQRAFDQDQQRWRNSINIQCSLPKDTLMFSPQQYACVVNAFQNRAAGLRAKLSGDVLVETRLSPEQHADIQESLIQNGFLQGTADGEFGVVTRQAIKRFQESEGSFQNGFLSSDQRIRLQRGSQPVASNENLQQEQSAKPKPDQTEPNVSKAEVPISQASKVGGSETPLTPLATLPTVLLQTLEAGSRPTQQSWSPEIIIGVGGHLGVLLLVAIVLVRSFVQKSPDGKQEAAENEYAADNNISGLPKSGSPFDTDQQGSKQNVAPMAGDVALSDRIEPTSNASRKLLPSSKDDEPTPFVSSNGDSPKSNVKDIVVLIDQLTQFFELRSAATITQNEFQTIKARLFKDARLSIGNST